MDLLPLVVVSWWFTHLLLHHHPISLSQQFKVKGLLKTSCSPVQKNDNGMACSCPQQALARDAFCLPVTLPSPYMATSRFLACGVLRPFLRTLRETILLPLSLPYSLKKNTSSWEGKLIRPARNRRILCSPVPPLSMLPYGLGGQWGSAEGRILSLPPHWSLPSLKKAVDLIDLLGCSFQLISLYLGLPSLGSVSTVHPSWARSSLWELGRNFLSRQKLTDALKVFWLTQSTMQACFG